MRLHPITLALRYPKGQRSFRAAPYHGNAPYLNDAEAVADLRRWTGQDFGTNAAAWGNWLRSHRSAYRTPR